MPRWGQVRRHPALRAGAGLAALALAVLAQQSFGRAAVADGALLAVLGAVLLDLVLPADTPLLETPAARPPEAAAAARWWPSGRTLLLLVGALALNGVVLLAQQGPVVPASAAVLLFASVGLFLAAAIGYDRDRHLGRSRTPSSAPSRAWVVVVALTLLAAALRLYQLDQLPYGVWYDESNTALRVQEVVFGQRELRVFFAEDIFRPVHMYSFALSMALLGPTVWAIRLPEALAGALAVPAFYLAGRHLFDWRVGIVAAALVATARWHLTFSRLAFDGIWVPLCIALAVGLAARALARRSALDAALAGLVVGFGLYSYIPFRIFPPVLALFVLHLALARRRGARSAATTLVVVGLGAALLASPLLAFAARNPAEMTGRTATASVFSKVSNPEGPEAAIVENVRKHLQMFNVRGDPNGRHNVPGEPMLDPLSGGLFAVGLGLALLRVYRPANAFLLVNLAALMLGGILSVDFEAPQSLRSIGTMVSAYLLAAVPLAATWELLERALAAQRLPALLPRLGRPGWLARPGPSGPPGPPGQPDGPPGSGWLGSPGRIARTSWPVRTGWPGWRPLAAPWWRAVPASLVGLALVAIAQANVAGYFVRQAANFSSWAVHSTAETAIARRMLATSPDRAEVLVSDMYHNHPTLQFLASGGPPVRPFQLGASLPLRTARDELQVYLDPEQRAVFSQLRAYYPTAHFEEIQLPGGSPPVLLAARLTRADLAAVQGIEARFFAGPEPAGEPVRRVRLPGLDVDWSTAAAGLQPPYSVEMEGTLFAARYGRYAFQVEGPPLELDLDGQRLLAPDRPSADQTLARGTHALRLRLRVPDAAPPTRLLWQPPQESRRVVATDDLYVPPVTASGLLGRYYPNPSWSGQPGLEQVDPSLGMYFQVVPLPRPYSVEWTGKLYAPVDGAYQLGVQQISLAQVFVDDVLLVDNREHDRLQQAPVTLAAGYHDLRVRFVDRDAYSRIYLYWQVPGRARELIPSSYLLPPMGSYPPRPPALASAPAPPPVAAPPPAVVARGASATVARGSGAAVGQGSPSATGQGSAAAGLQGPPPRVLDVPARVLLAPDLVVGSQGSGPGELSGPRGVAVGPDGSIFVADTGNARVQKFDAAGRFLLAWGRPGEGDGEFQEPVAVAVDPRGEVLVLDAATAWVQRFDQGGQLLGRLAGPAARLYRPRGLAVDRLGNLYVADTGGARVVALGPDGSPGPSIGSLGSGPGQLLEPTDVLALDDGDLLVLDTGNGRLQRLGPQGQFRAEWLLGRNLAAEGPHVARAPDGSILLTDPERQRVLLLDAQLTPRLAFGEEGSGPGQLRRPVGVAVDRQGAVYVVDAHGHRVQRFRP